jgi:hypothetical protein
MSLRGWVLSSDFAPIVVIGMGLALGYTRI